MTDSRFREPAVQVTHSVVVPVYGNADSIQELVERLTALAGRIPGHMEAVFVVDGSPDDSEGELRRAIPSHRLDAQLLSLSRNFGSFSAIRAGLRVARGNSIAVMAADLQEPVEVVERFFQLLDADVCDIALGQRIARADPAVASGMYWSLYRRFVNREIPPGGVDVFGCTGEIGRRIVEFPEHHTSLVGLLFWVGYRRRFVPYERQPRLSGRSGWSTSKKIRYFLDSVFAFTDLPILLLQAIGLVGLVGSTLLGLLIFAVWALGGIDQPGYTPLMITLLVSTSAILMGLGVVGNYVWRGYENSKSRPHELVARHETYTSGLADPLPVHREVRKVS